MKNNLSLDEVLSKADRIISYTFGLVAGGVVLTGLIVGLGWAWKKSQQAPPGQILPLHQISAEDKQIKNLQNPFRHAQTIYFEFPYLHGAHPQTIGFLAELKAQQSASLPGGFQISGEYRSEAGNTPIELALTCQGLCHLAFQMPARYVLPPQRIKGKLHYPLRHFQIQSGQVIFHVENSRLTGVSRPGQASIFPFSNSYQAPHREKYWGPDGQEIKP